MISECFTINNREYTFVTFYGNRSLYHDVLSNLENREVRPLDYKYLLFFLGPKIWHFCYFHHDFKHQESFYTNGDNMQSHLLYGSEFCCHQLSTLACLSGEDYSWLFMHWKFLSITFYWKNIFLQWHVDYIDKKGN